jgi:pseudaminic acid biosynthesis-associated methylase
MSNDEIKAEAKRLEALWAGEFGDAYVERNRKAGEPRELFWREIIDICKPQRALEVGCNMGGNLRWIAAQLPPQNVYGIDINLKALDELHRSAPAINALYSPARELPFRDRWFDLTFTMGVLIHQPESTLPLVMAELVRCSQRYVLCGEYYADHLTEVPYRGERGALLKRNYGKIYQELFPELQLRKQWFMGRDQGWDDITIWLFERS